MTKAEKVFGIDVTKSISEDPKDVQQLLSFLQRTMKVPKSQYNKFGEFWYRDAEDILEAAKPLLPDGATLECDDEVIVLGDRFYVKSTAVLEYKGSSKKKSASAREPLSKKGMDEMQITGAASSYARKGALGGLLAIDDTKDSDKTSKEKKKDVDNARLMDQTGTKTVNDAKTAKALGGSIRSHVSPEDIKVMYDQAIVSLGGCADFDGLKKVWANYYKTRTTFSAEQWADIAQKYNECKEGFGVTTNGAHH